ncbi:MAG: T9SS type B sorting domain-containing protein [Bacteroidetes bacterium]|nr:MAG: T9SS type B sorting domain-containing protein [Bacteroidota bacterium]
MKIKIIFIALVGLTLYPELHPSNCFAQGTWVQKANVGGPVRTFAVGFSIGTKGYIGTGTSGIADFWEYDPSANTWTQKANFSGGVRYGAVGFSIGTKGYIGTGCNNGFSVFNDFWEYDPSVNTWIQKANFGGAPRTSAVGFSIGTKGYIGTGSLTCMTISSMAQDFWEYDPSVNTWTQKTNFGGASRGYAAGFSIGTKGYIGTGLGTISYYNDFWEWDQATNAWTQIANFGPARCEAIGFSIGNCGYIGVGTVSIPTGSMDDFWRYDASTNTWVQDANFGGGLREAVAAFSIGCKGYVGTGWVNDANPKTDFWEFTPASSGSCACSVLSISIAFANPLCSGQCIGTATATPTAGTSPYTYNWSNAQTIQVITGLCAGNYSVLVTDASGNTATANITITQPAAITTTVSSTNASCGNNNGTATVNASGGTPVYTYSWSPSGCTASSCSGLGAGNYSVTITDANGCTQTATVSVTSTAGPTVTTSSTPQTCTQGGTATANASGGNSPYTYQWCNGASISSATGLSAGSCTVIVTDASGCSTTSTVTITASGNIPTASVTATSASCGNNNGTATANVSGGTSPYTYSWNPSSQITSTITGLSAGNYTCTVTDATGCAAVQNVSVSASSAVIAGVSATPSACGNNNGTATVNASGGNSPYAYSWSSGYTTSSCTGFAAGNYSVTITDVNGCAQTATIAVTQSGGGPVATVASNVTITSGQSATLTAGGGGTYQWSNGSTNNPIIVTPPVTTIYCITVTDINNCSDTACVTVTVETEPIDCGYADDQLFIPDAFSPNNDTKNDELGVYYPNPDCIKEFVLIIYDRWGEKVFEANNITAAWDGTYKGQLMNTAVFVWYMKVSFIDGNEVVRKGNVSLIK